MRQRMVETIQYMTMSKHRECRLDARCDTLEKLKHEIDASNERAVKQGYKPQQWIITQVRRILWTEEDGTFISENTEEKAIGVYPKEL